MAAGSTFHNLENFDLHEFFCKCGCFLGSEQSRIKTKGNLLNRANFENFSFVSGVTDNYSTNVRTAPPRTSCTSNLLSKNLLQDEEINFAGMIRVDPVAQQTNALQTNRNLLSKEAEANSLRIRNISKRCQLYSRCNNESLRSGRIILSLSRGIDKKSAESLFR